MMHNLRSLQGGIPHVRLRLKKKPAQTKWDEVLHTAEMILVQLLHVESSNVTAKLENDLEDHLKRDYPDRLSEKRFQI